MPEMKMEGLLYNLALCVGYQRGLIHQLNDNDEVLGILNDRGVTKTDIANLDEALSVIVKGFYPRSPGISPESLSE